MADETAKAIEVLRNNFFEADVQQFIANTIATLQVFAYSPELDALPLVCHTYELTDETPESSRADLDPENLARHVDRAAARRRVDAHALWAQIEVRAQRMTERRRRIRDGRSRARDIEQCTVLDAVAKLQPKFDRHSPLGESQLREIIAHQGIEIVEKLDIPVMSACVVYREAASDSVAHRVYLRPGLPPVMKALLLAHELGHWWLHVNSTKIELEASGLQADPLLGANHTWGDHEREADLFASATIFSTKYLFWRELADGLTVDAICSDFVRGEKLDAFLRARVEKHIQQRLDVFRDEKLYLTTRVQGWYSNRDEALSPEDLAPRQETWNSDKLAWSKLDGNNCVCDCNEFFSGMFGMSRSEFLERRLHIVTDLTPLYLRDRLSSQLKFKAENGRPTLYVTSYLHPDTGKELSVLVNAFPIREHGAHVGSLALSTLYPEDGASGENVKSPLWVESFQRVPEPSIRDLARMLEDLSTQFVDLRRDLGSLDDGAHERSLDDQATIRFLDLDKRAAAFAALDREDVIYEALRMAAVRMEARGLDVLAEGGLKIDTDFQIIDYGQLMADDELGRALRKKHIDALKLRYKLTLSK